MAARRGREKIVHRLLETQALIGPTDEDGPLSLAAEGGHEGTVLLLLRHGADASEDKTGGKALIRAASSGQERVVKVLLENGADPNTRDSAEHTALMLAVREGHGAVVHELLASGANVNLKDEQGLTALMCGTEVTREQTSIVEQLLYNQASVNEKDSIDGSTALMRAVLEGHTMVVESLLCHGADVNIRNNNGVTPLMLATHGGNSNAIAMQLLEHGAHH